MEKAKCERCQDHGCLACQPTPVSVPQEAEWEKSVDAIFNRYDSPLPANDDYYLVDAKKDIKILIINTIKSIEKSAYERGARDGYGQGWKDRDDGDGTDYENPFASTN